MVLGFRRNDLRIDLANILIYFNKSCCFPKLSDAPASGFSAVKSPVRVNVPKIFFPVCRRKMSSAFPSSASVPLVSRGGTYTIINSDFVDGAQNRLSQGEIICPMLRLMTCRGMKTDFLATHLGVPSVVRNTQQYHQENITIFSSNFRYSTTLRGNKHKGGRIWFNDGSLKEEYMETFCLSYKIKPVDFFIIRKVRQEALELKFGETTCPCCLDDLSGAQLRQCDNKHSVCAECFEKIPGRKTCPTCRADFKNLNHLTVIDKTVYFQFEYGFSQFLGLLKIYATECRYDAGLPQVFNVKHFIIASSYWYYAVHINPEGASIDVLDINKRYSDNIAPIEIQGFKNACDWITGADNLYRLERYYDLYYMIDNQMSESAFVGYLKEEFGAEVALDMMAGYASNQSAKHRQKIRQYLRWNIKNMEERHICLTLGQIMENIFFIGEKNSRSVYITKREIDDVQN